jgi:hypothetical protein
MGYTIDKKNSCCICMPARINSALLLYKAPLASKLQLKKPNRILMMVIASNVTNLPILVGG